MSGSGRDRGYRAFERRCSLQDSERISERSGRSNSSSGGISGVGAGEGCSQREIETRISVCGAVKVRKRRSTVYVLERYSID